ncbi:hypothetical protein [Siminovitchia terrae]|uniref:hypothetical protein n=1 Tax=Siminovitchia terrae TaxID=1914933 RepID=UPI0028A8FED8|nr:hypothetical protein [Siminovitchia terrae]
MSEWLTTGQMIDGLEAGMNAISNCGEIKVEHEDSRLQFYNVWTGSEYAYFHDGIKKAKWRILPKYVSFDEAMKAHEAGKVVCYHGHTDQVELWDRLLPSQKCIRVSSTGLGDFSLLGMWKGKWTIEDDSDD